VDYEKVELNPHTNHEYIEKKYKKKFAKNLPQEHAGLTGGGIQLCLDTKKLNNYSNKLEYRSMHMHACEELNPNLNISNSNNSTCCDKDFQSDTTESADTEKAGGKKESLSVVPSPSSKRLSEGKTFKKHKIRNQKTVAFPSRKYQKPKTLSDMLPVLTDRICQEIIARSGRLDFTVNFIMQTVEKLVKKPDVNPIFHSLKGFIAYMSWCIKHELHDAVKCSNDRFRFKCNIKEENQQGDKPLQKFLHRKSLDLPDTLLGKIRRRLIELYEDNGVALDNHWFSKMQPVIDEQEKTFKLSASSEVVVDWIKNNCWQKLKVATASVELELIEV
jgi:hypothetical protein